MSLTIMTNENIRNYQKRIQLNDVPVCNSSSGHASDVIAMISTSSFSFIDDESRALTYYTPLEYPAKDALFRSDTRRNNNSNTIRSYNILVYNMISKRLHTHI